MDDERHRDLFDWFERRISHGLECESRSLLQRRRNLSWARNCYYLAAVEMTRHKIEFGESFFSSLFFFLMQSDGDTFDASSRSSLNRYISPLSFPHPTASSSIRSNLICQRDVFVLENEGVIVLTRLRTSDVCDGERRNQLIDICRNSEKTTTTTKTAASPSSTN